MLQQRHRKSGAALDGNVENIHELPISMKSEDSAGGAAPTQKIATEGRRRRVDARPNRYFGAVRM
jgi:hypothetical protein